MIRAILFDLDDTLYEERQFFRSGFLAVGAALQQRGVGATATTAKMLEEFHHRDERERVLQKLAEKLSFPLEWIPELVSVFRSHTPDIRLADDVREVLPRLRARHRLGCVTDGWAPVQRAKMRVLEVEPLLDAVVVADDFGRERWKPHPFPFQRCCELLGALPSESVFVGDNPQRDMLGARNAGLYAVRIRRLGGYFSSRQPSPSDPAADCEVRSLTELERVIANLWPTCEN